MSRWSKSKAKAADREPKVDITQADELGLTGAGRKVSIAAWALSAFVIVAGIVALVVTGQKIFILFIVLGIVTPLNVLAYDSFILKPKIARLKSERAKEAEEKAREAEAAAREEAAAPEGDAREDGARKPDAGEPDVKASDAKEIEQ